MVGSPTATDVTLINNGAAVASVNFRVRIEHSTVSNGNDPLIWRGASAGGSAAPDVFLPPFAYFDDFFDPTITDIPANGPWRQAVDGSSSAIGMVIAWSSMVQSVQIGDLSTELEELI